MTTKTMPETKPVTHQFGHLFDRMKTAPNRERKLSPGPNPQIELDDWRATVNGTRKAMLPASQVDAFWAKVDRSGGPDSCWPWSGAVNKVSGYGVFHPSRTSGYPLTVNAHRFAASLAGVVDLADPQQQVDHACHNWAGCAPGPCEHRKCCNPRHHRPTGLTENVNNSHNANKWKTHCPKGHEYTPENTRTQAKKNTICRKCIACEQQRERARAPRRSA